MMFFIVNKHTAHMFGSQPLWTVTVGKVYAIVYARSSVQSEGA